MHSRLLSTGVLFCDHFTASSAKRSQDNLSKEFHMSLRQGERALLPGHSIGAILATPAFKVPKDEVKWADAGTASREVGADGVLEQGICKDKSIGKLNTNH